MFINGQTINYDRYLSALQNMPAPIMVDQLPDVQIDLIGLIEYAHRKGVKAGELTEEEKNRFIVGDTVSSLQEKVKKSVKYRSLAEWNTAKETVTAL